MSPDRLTFRVTGMTCDHCARTVEKTLSALPGIASCQVSYEKGHGEALLESPLSLESLREAVKPRGYDLLPDAPSGSEGSAPA